MFSLMTVAIVMSGMFGQRQSGAGQLAWLTGCWELNRDGRHVIEQWTAPEAGTLLGLSRTVVAGKTREYEFMLIREGETGLEYVAKPSGQPEATFTAIRVSADEVVFENPQHDFPTRVMYRLEKTGGLVAAIEGNRNGTLRRIEYPYVAASCGR
jgi:Domain of unknown function (DUF6265)